MAQLRSGKRLWGCMFDREKLIDRIYEAAVVPELWPGVLQDVSLLGGCFGGVLFTTAAREVTRWTSSESAKSIFEDFLSNRAAQEDNIRLKYGVAAKHHGFFGNHQLYGRAEMDRSPMYSNFFFPKGLGYAAGSVLPMPNGDIAVFNLERRYSDGPVSSEEIARLNAVRPHLARAAALSTRLNLQRARAIVDALNSAGMPAAILGGQNELLAANSLLEKMSDQIVFLAHGKLALGNAASNRLLMDGLANRSRPATSSIPIPARADSPAAVMHALPLPGEASDVFNGARTLLVVTRLDRPTSPTAELLTGLFDLTASEARVARGIAEGKSTDEVAAALGLSRETVRFYLKGIFGKTGVARQSDLIALLSGAVLPRS
ncbi:LuxR C-terminal-related transcriptional regulator [Bosea sp. ANAM02]|uniref:helix-turn-helix transcriptional regulator n=1 Tax=Bosea sp. ANAM02 TaxID=2020412 RepID=UPI001563EA4A|nr:LuxR C-terminal-related transcriptional regulator [Bosea sp. ANAM02]